MSIKNKDKVESAKRTVSTVTFREEVVPKYVFKEVVKEIPKLQEVPIEGISKRDLEFIKEIGNELKKVYATLQAIRQYRIQEEVVRIPKYILIDKEVKVDKVSYKNVEVTNAIVKPVEVEKPVYKEKVVEIPITKYIETVKEVVNAVVKDVIVKNAVPYDVEVQNVIIRDKVINTIQELVEHQKKQKIASEL